MTVQTELDNRLKNRQRIILIISVSALIGFIFTTYALLTNWAATEFIIEMPEEGTYVTNWAAITPLVLLAIFDAGFFSVFALMIYSYFKSDSQPKDNGKMDRRDWRFSIAVIGTFILLLASILMICVVGSLKITSAFQLALIIVFGVITLLSSLVIASVVLKVLNLQNPNEALGLPPGSVRAIIALMLILIFAIMSIFMYQYLNQPTETEVLTIISNTTDSSTGEYIFRNSTTIQSHGGTSDALIDFSKQTLTTLSTLVVALAAFYFGTKSVAQAQREQPTVNLTIAPGSPVDLNLDENQAIDPIKVATIPKNEQVEFSVEGDPEGKIIRSSEPNVFRYEPSDGIKNTTVPKQVILKFWMTKYPEDIEELKVQIKPRTQPTPTQQIAETQKRISALEKQAEELDKEMAELDEEGETE